MHVFRALLYGVLWTADASPGHTHFPSSAYCFLYASLAFKTPIFNTEQMNILSQSSQCLPRLST